MYGLKMPKKFIVLFLLFGMNLSAYSSVIGTCLSGQYKEENGQVFYGFDDNPIPDIVEIKKWTEIAHAEGKSFKVLAGDFAKDRHGVYYTGKLIKTADPKTFEILDYKKDNYREIKCFPYAADKNHIYYYADIIEGADVATFKRTGPFSAQDKRYDYKGNERTSRTD